MDLVPVDDPVFSPEHVSGQPVTEALARVAAWWAKASQVYPDNTKKAWRCDWNLFLSFCTGHGLSTLPATSATVASFVEACRLLEKKPATTRRYLSTIARAHKVAGLVNPCDDDFVQLEIKDLYNVMSARQRQARALGWEHINAFIEKAGKGIKAARERAILSVAYDLMARRAEIAALNLDDLSFLSDGTGRALIRRSKTDQAGEGNSAYLTRDSVRWLKEWMQLARIREGALFRRLIGKDRIGERLSADAIGEIFKRVASFIGFSPDEAAAVSGHSIRVGAAQDLLALNIDLGSVMQAGRWKSSRMPMRYAEHVLAARGGIGRAATLQGRDKESPSNQDSVRMPKKKSLSPTVTQPGLEATIARSGGKTYAQEFAPALLAKIQLLEERGTYGPLIDPVRRAANQGDLRGRALEINLAYQLENVDIHAEVEVKQGGPGDIDFRFDVGRHNVFIETKLLREDDKTRAAIDAQLKKSNTYAIFRHGDTDAVFRLQRDLFSKATTRKFNPKPEAGWVNLVGIDVSEVLSGMVDVGDCVLAAGGNATLTQFDDSYQRPNVIGVFERPVAASMTKEQQKWADALSALIGTSPHPRDYIHGAVFLFRYPKDTAALVYRLKCAVVWNSHLVDHQLASELEPAIHAAIPRMPLRN